MVIFNSYVKLPEDKYKPFPGKWVVYDIVLPRFFFRQIPLKYINITIFVG